MCICSTFCLQFHLEKLGFLSLGSGNAVFPWRLVNAFALQVCLMIEALSDGAVKMGLNRDAAQKLAAHTLMVFIYTKIYIS